MGPMVLKASSFKGLCFMISCTLIILKISLFFITFIPSTSNLTMIHPGDHGNRRFDIEQPFDGQTAEIINPDHRKISIHRQYDDDIPVTHEVLDQPPEKGKLDPSPYEVVRSPEKTGHPWQRGGAEIPLMDISQAAVHEGGRQSAGGSTATKTSAEDSTPAKGKPVNSKELYHNKDIFLENYTQMNRSLKIFVYPHARTDRFANVLLPDTSGSPGGNYASESYFKIALSMSHFVTQDPSEADLFFLPFSIASMRHDKRIGAGGIQSFIKDYITNISRKYPFWNRTGGADHFYVACHSIGRNAMEKAPEVRINAIQVVCSSSYFLQGYTAHKDASVPQIWPRPGIRPTRHPSKREMLAFYAGAMNSRVRESLVRTWINDTEIGVHRSRLKTPYSESLLGSKFCIHAKGFEVNTARIGDAIYYGCVPVVLADHYDLPFADILNWDSFSVIILTEDVPFLKKILKEIVDSEEYLKLQKNVVKVQNHFQWHRKPVDFDIFYMVMYELWLRRSSIRIHLFN